MGPTTENDEIVEKMIVSGMNVARFNFSHGNHEYHKSQMERVKRVSEKVCKPVALLMDTKGPEIRTGDVEGNGTILINEGDKVIVTVDGCFSREASDGKSANISLSWKDFPKKTKPGVKILIADGLLSLNVDYVEGEKVHCTADNSAKIGSRKNVNLIGLHAGLPILSEQDKKDIAFAHEMDCDFVAASFVSFANEVREIRKYLDSLGSKMKIIAKIENEEGLDNIEEIAEVADGIMVARGDLGVQLPTERIPLAQKHIIEVVRKKGKVVITATQMLDSMIVNPRPTRAELTDVANAIFDGTDAVMLSGETANGAYPVESVMTMARIAKSVEDSEEYCERIKDTAQNLDTDISLGRAMAHMAYLTAGKIKSMAILVPTLSGHTARMISTFRPEQSIFAVTPDHRVQRQLLLNWGVIPLYTPKLADDSEEMIQNAVKTIVSDKFVNQGDRIVLCAGIPLSSPIPVNTIRILIVGNVMARGRNGGVGVVKTKISGRIVKADSPEEAINNLRGKRGEIFLCSHIDENWIPIIRIIDGMIVTGSCDLPADMVHLINPKLVWVSDIGMDTSNIENGLTVTVNGKDLLVYEGEF